MNYVFLNLCKKNQFEKAKEVLNKNKIDKKIVQQGYDIVVQNGNNVPFEFLLLKHGARMKYAHRLDNVWIPNHDYFFGPETTF